MAKKGTIADAYVNLIPSAEGFKSGVEKAINEGTSAGAKSASLGIGNLVSGFTMGIGQAAFNAVTELGSKVVDVAKSSISTYAEYEQLVGGVETLFGTASSRVMRNASEAYESAGLSINEYMETVNSMAASLNQATKNEYESVRLADIAVVDMADNANKMGTSMESIQNAYSGFTKQNFTMLDNLKLGYGGTQKEMARLLEDATKLSGVEYNIESYADIVKAIHVIQEEMGIARTTQKEAATTIQGSLAMVQGAWTNLISGIANEDADLGDLFTKLIDSIFGEDGKGGFVGNIMPRIEQALQGVTEFIQIGLQRMPEIISTILPDLIKSFSDVILSIFENINTNSDEIIQNVGDIFGLLIENALKLVTSLVTTLPTILEMAINLITTLANGIAESIPVLVPTIIEVLTTILEVIMDNLSIILDAAVNIIDALIEGLLDNLPEISLAVTKIMWKMVATFISLLPQIVEVAFKIVFTLISSMISTLLEFVSGDFWQEAISSIVHSFTDIDWEGVGTKCIEGIVSGFTKAVDKVKNTATNVAESIKKIFTDGFQIKSPSRVFRYYGEMIDEGLAIGIDSGESEIAAQELAQNVNDDFRNTISYSNDSTSSDNSALINLLSEQNDLLLAILNKNYARSDAEIFRTVRKESKGYLKQTGSFAF